MNFNDIENIIIPEGEVIKINNRNHTLWSKKSDCFCFIPEGESTTATITCSAYGNVTKSLLYSTDGVNFNEWGTVSSSNTLTYKLNTKNNLYIKSATNNGTFSTGTATYIKFTSSGRVKVAGDLMALCYTDYKEDRTITSSSKFHALFNDSKNIYDASGLFCSAKNSVFGPFQSMFSGSQINKPMIIDERSLGNYAYGTMYSNCSYLKTTPDIPKPTTATAGGHQYENMFQRSKIQKTGNIYLTSLYGSQNMFKDCTSLKETTWRSTNPPSISSSTFEGCPSDMIIYVPDESVTLYKEAAVWIERAAYIKPISEKPTA